MPLASSSILKKLGETAKALRTLPYLFRFLDAYDFASEGKEEIQKENRSLINASVLGKVFEKINGYKDGSIYTPGFITMYMCRQAIRLAVVQKFTDECGFNGADFGELKNWIGDRNHQKENIRKFNAAIDSLKICDPAVGSGHFLVSALNEILAIKSELKIFADADGNRFGEYTIEIANDELIIADRENLLFEYKVRDGQPLNAEMQRLQSTLFHEKQRLIENCLFGVDINPNSVKICRLRLWIELLKNAYYKFGVPPLGGVPAGEEPPKGGTPNELETLPNIDINIKEGNSLISRFKLHDTFKSEATNKIVKEYRSLIDEAKNVKDRARKEELKLLVRNHKKALSSSLEDETTAIRQKLDKKHARVNEINHPKLFEKTSEAEREMMTRKIKTEIEKLETELKKVEQKYDNSFEWRYEYPEVLDDDGKFLGFDIVIGNPPYIKEYENKNAFNGLQSLECYQGKMDIWYLFGAHALTLLKESSYLSFIATNNWTTNSGASKFRNYVIRNSKILALADFGANMIFENASIQTMVMQLQKDSLSSEYAFDYRKLEGSSASKESVTNFLVSNKVENGVFLTPKIRRKALVDKTFTFNTGDDGNILDKIKSKHNFVLREKDDRKRGLISELGQGIVSPQDFVNSTSAKTLGTGVNIGDGIFILSQIELKSLTLTDKEMELIKPYYTTEELGKFYGNHKNQFWIIYTKSDINKIDPKTRKPRISAYPNVKNHLDRFKKVITSDFKPYGLHRARELHFFLDEKIIVRRKCAVEPTFTYTDFPCFVSQTFYVIQTSRIDMKYLTALLNSSLIKFWLKRKGKMQGDIYQIDKEPLLEIPLLSGPKKKQLLLVKEIDKILDLKKSGGDTTEIENRIDEMVFDLYELTEDEKQLIRSNG